MTELYIARARDASSVEDCLSIYDKWAQSYNAEVGDEAQNYVAPVLVAQTAISLLKDAATGSILDAGCGTGLVGQALAIGGAKVIDGVDLSPAMLKIARKTGVYRDLAEVDLLRRIDIADSRYDMVTCVGTFTRGHVGPDPALLEFVRIVKKNGTILATILEEIWDSMGFKDEVARLAENKIVKVLSEEKIDYVKGHGDKAVLIVLEKIVS